MPLINKRMLALENKQNNNNNNNNKNSVTRGNRIDQSTIKFWLRRPQMCDAIQADQLPFPLLSQEDKTGLCSQGDDGISLLYNFTCLIFFFYLNPCGDCVASRRLRVVADTLCGHYYHWWSIERHCEVDILQHKRYGLLFVTFQLL